MFVFNNWRSSSKSIHVTMALVTIVFMGVFFWFVPDSRKDAVAVFTNAGVFVTLYGVLFAIIEVGRVGSAAFQAKEAADEARETVLSAYSLRDSTECQSNIDLVLHGLDAGDAIPSAGLNRIARLYSAEFYEEMDDENGAERKNVAMLQSYVVVARPGAPRSTGKLKKALMRMSSDLATRAQSKIAKRNKS